MDSRTSSTWFLDACGQSTRRRQRLLLTNYDLGPPVRVENLQPGLDFSPAKPELFRGAEMGEDALRVLRVYRKQEADIREKVQTEVDPLKQALRWAGKWDRMAVT